MKIELINPLNYTEDKQTKNLKNKIFVCLNQHQHIETSITNLINLNKQVLYVPSPNIFWNTDFLVYEKELKSILESTNNIYYLNNKTKTFSDRITKKSYRFIGGIFWNDYEGLNTQLVTMSLMKSKHFSKIKAHTWFSIPENLEKFNEINEKLLLNNTYYKTFNQYYKKDFFHPIISYLLYIQNLNYLKRKISQPFNGINILLTQNHPTSHALYFSDIQVDNSSHKLYEALGKNLNAELYIGRKTSLEESLQKLPIHYLIHTNSDKNYSYKYFNTNIFTSNNTNQVIDFSKNNSNECIKNTLHYLLDENQKFVEIIKNSLLNKINIIENTQDIIDFVKGYNYSITLIKQDTWIPLLKKYNIIIKNINLDVLNLSDLEITTNQLNSSEQSKRISLILTILSENYYSLNQLNNNLI